MCDCNKNIVDLSHTKIYTIMATYKGKLTSGKSYYNTDSYIDWANTTQEELAYAYEHGGLNNLIEKLTKTKDESEKTSKKKSSKKADSTKE